MRIGLLASTGGMLDSFFIEIAESWRSHGHDVSFAAGTPMDAARATVIPGLSRRPDLRMLRALSGLSQWSKRESLDVIVTNSATASALVRLAGGTAPVVYFCHGLHWNETRSIGDRVWPLIERALLPRTDGIISLNSDDQRWFAARFAGRPQLHLSTGVGLDLLDYPVRPLPEGPLRLCWIGEFSDRKRPHLALDIAAHLHSTGLTFRLEMLGDGEFRPEIRAEIESRGLSGIVTANGTGDAAAALERSHALVHTSQWEGLPRVMLESLAMGCPSYAFDVKGVRDIPLARLTADGDTEALAARICADWTSGRLLEPISFDRGALDYSHAADGILRFLPSLVGNGADSPAGGEATSCRMS
ncbi:glycosyltransferase [Brevibacterium sp. JSBI002]|uniref:glycosyltransferase n=1 Tax=Brevibacterium sp. JSBI002 TaxID=2886045 RepID=UPI00223128B1|nr:glycosyltransferase [Brevibacterium sp. JSBI002]UZD62009.1 glycosyltransferase [Brevibacterium sp. JSBI002]